MTAEQQARHDSEYQSLVALYIVLLQSLRSEEKEEALFALAKLRTEIAFNYALNGLGVDYDTATSLLTSKDTNLTQQDKDLKDRINAAIKNLIDFSVCEEYQLFDETIDALEEDEEVDFNSEKYTELLLLCKKYNDTYAAIENADIAYAGIIAAKWITMSASDRVVYYTMNDVHVRPWHMSLHGYTALRDDFPSWMIPPIEYNCRCFIESLNEGEVNASLRPVKGSNKKTNKPKQINDVYSDSLAKCGRIFGPAHSYFVIKKRDKKMLDKFVTRLKTEYGCE